MSKSPAGYSGTSLAKKLGIGEGAVVVPLSPPDGYAELLAPLPPVVPAPRLRVRPAGS